MEVKVPVALPPGTENPQVADVIESPYVTKREQVWIQLSKILYVQNHVLWNPADKVKLNGNTTLRL